MSGEDWIKQRITKAKADLPLLTEPILARAEELLGGQLSEGELSKGHLVSLAKELIAGMASVPPGAGAEE